MLRRTSAGLFALALLAAAAATGRDQPRLKLLLLGDRGHHRPHEFAKIVGDALAKCGIDATFTVDVAELVPETLAKYDALMIFRDSGELPPKNESALLDFVEGGKGVVAVHCASHTFRNSSRYTALVGGRFWKHGTGTFAAKIIDAAHPAMRGLAPFASWDETYRHNELADDIRVLMAREESGGYEPYTWVRQQGRGRVYYTALGHDERTWKELGFHALLANGVKWTAGRLKPRDDLKPFEYVEAKIPNYVPKASWGTQAEPIARMQKPLPPEESVKHFTTPHGFTVELFASEPLIQGKPIAMAWDERGRLWLAETVDYPNDLHKQGEGNDRIVILDDTDGDGRADKRTVFADKLSVPTSLVHSNGGLIVTAYPDTLFFKDTSGDGVADERRVLFTGWGAGDTHAGPSNLRYGFDNWIWGTVGYSGYSGTVDDKPHKFGQGIFRFKPDGSVLEFVTPTSNNTWGLGFMEEGDVLASTANNDQSWFLGVPNRTFEGVRGWYGKGSAFAADFRKLHPITDKVRQVDWHGGFTAAAGHAVYTARSFPKEYWNRAAFVCEPTGHLVSTHWLTRDGSNIVAKDGFNILASDDEWCAPTMAEVGPDGALWVIDWYAYIVQHNPTPHGFHTGKGNAYETPLRDKTHGRIYRVVHKASKPSAKPKLDTAEQQAAALRSDNLFWRMTAQRLMVEQLVRGVPDTRAMTVALDTATDPKAGPGAANAMRVVRFFGSGIDLEGKAALIRHPEAAVRRALLDGMTRDEQMVKVIVDHQCLNDPDAGVRLTALHALAEMPGSPAVAAAVAAMMAEDRNASDRWIPLAAIAAAAPSGIDFLAQPNAKPEALKIVAGHVARGGKLDLARLFDAAAANPANADAILGGVAAAWPANQPLPFNAAAESSLKALTAKLPATALPSLAALLKAGGKADTLATIAGDVICALTVRVADDKVNEAERLAAARDLIALGGDKESAKLLQTLSAKSSPTWARGVFDALAESRSDAVGPAVVARWDELTPAVRSSAVALLARRTAWAKALVDGMEKGTVDKGDLGVDQAQLLTRHPDKALAARAAKVFASSGRLPNPDRQAVLNRLAPLTKEAGDKVRGRVVFETNCAKCHKHGDLGANVGPDLTGMAVRERPELLIEILDPNRSVEGNYQQYSVLTKRGTSLQGLLAGETKTAVELLDAENKRHIVLREDIDELANTRKSLMPEGFESLPPADLASLLAFLTARDRFLPLPLSKAATIASSRGMFYAKEAEIERLVFPRWGTLTFDGVPFQVIDPRDGSVPNVVVLHGPIGAVSAQMPKSVSVPCNTPVKALHLLGGIAGWASPGGQPASVSLVVRFVYADGKTEDRELRNGVEIADYIRVVDVPGSKLAYTLRGQQQVRYLAIAPKRPAAKVERIEFVKGTDHTAPIIVAATVEVGG